MLFMPWCEWCWGEEPQGVLRAKLGNAGVRVSGVLPCSGEQGGFLPAVVNPPLAHRELSSLFFILCPHFQMFLVSGEKHLGGFCCGWG